WSEPRFSERKIVRPVVRAKSRPDRRSSSFRIAGLGFDGEYEKDSGLPDMAAIHAGESDRGHGSWRGFNCHDFHHHAGYLVWKPRRDSPHRRPGKRIW